MNKKVGDCDKQIFSGANFLGITQKLSQTGQYYNTMNIQ